jgi:ligand-binding sensor domain-containing protein/two-component sensor histidine kinase
MRFVTTIFFIAFLHFAPSCICQPSNFRLVTYSVKNGLANNYVNDCVSDKRGLLWIATQNGLSRFDGVNFKNYFHNEEDATSLPFNLIHRVNCDYKNRIWITGNDGIAYYDQVKDQFTSLNILTRDSRVYRVNSICIDNDNKKLWFANAGKLCKLDLETFQISNTSLTVKNSEALNIYQDHQHNIWLYDVNDGDIYQYNILTATGKKVNHSRRGRSLIEDKDGNLWMGCYIEGITNCRDTARKKIFFTDDYNNTSDHYIRDMEIAPAFTGDSLIWVATSESGIRFFNPSKKTFSSYALQYNVYNKSGLPDNHVNNLYYAADDILWVCTTSGISKINKNEQQFFTRSLPFLQIKAPALITGIFSISNSDDRWISTYGSGLIRFNNTTGKVTDWKYFNRALPLEDQKNNLNKQSVSDNSGNHWLASNNGLIKISPAGVVTNIPISFAGHDAPLSCLLADGDSVIWCGSIYNGLIKYNIKTNQYINFQKIVNYDAPLNSNTYSITKDKDAVLWLSSKDGLVSFDTKTNELRRYFNLSNANRNNNSNVIYAAIADNNNMLWLATIGGVVNFNPVSKKFTTVKGKNIPTGLCTSIKKDQQGFIWVYSAAGLCRIDPVTKSSYLFNELDGINILNDEQSNPIIDYPGDKWALGYKGDYTIFDPLKISADTIKAKTYITEVQVNNAFLHLSADSFVQAPFELAYNQNNIGFTFSGIDYTNSDKIIYAFMLEGYDKDWIAAGSKHFANYTNLNAGNYIFKVKSCNSSGLWNEQYAAFKFHIAAPFYKSWWFILLCFLLTVTLIAYLIKIKERRRLAQQKLRDKIARDLHDDVGSSISGINLFSKMALAKMNDDMESKELVQKIVDRSETMVDAMSDIVWSVNPVNDSLDKVIIRMRGYALDMLEEQNIEVKFITPANIDKLKLDVDIRKDFYLIFKEAINNISKYAVAKNVTISLSISKNSLIMTIADDGTGFDTGKEYEGNGLKNIKARTENIKGKLILLSQQDKGTRLTIEIAL